MSPLHPEYLNNLAEAKDFELFVQDCLLRTKNFYIGIYKHKYFQIRYGESHSGLEVKLDKLSKSTGRLFIETAERTSVYDKWKPSGIYHEYSPWLFAVGTEQKFWLFFTKHLRQYAELPNQYEEITASHQTAKGFLLSGEKADILCGYIWESTNQKNQ